MSYSYYRSYKISPLALKILETQFEIFLKLQAYIIGKVYYLIIQANIQL